MTDKPPARPFPFLCRPATAMSYVVYPLFQGTNMFNGPLVQLLDTAGDGKRGGGDFEIALRAESEEALLTEGRTS
jgi:hypothetical protein